MYLQFVGCGDAFGSGGRFNTCFHLVGKDINALIDCGATSLVSMNKLAINRNDIDVIFITHFHADHIGGLPFFILESNFVLKRQRGLTIVGPPGLQSRYAALMQAAFPGSQSLELSFPLTLRELEIGKPNAIGHTRLTPFHVVFAMFRAAVGSAGVAARGEAGNGVAPDAARIGRHLARAYAQRGVVVIDPGA